MSDEAMYAGGGIIPRWNELMEKIRRWFNGEQKPADGDELRNEIAALAGMAAYAGGYNDWKAATLEAYGGGYDIDASSVFAYGGCGCSSGVAKMGGADGANGADDATLRDYGNSLNSKTKQRIFADILEAARKIGLKTQGADEAAQIRSLIDSIPAPERFKKGDAAQTATCVGIANAINNAHGSKIIDVALPAEVICQHIIEVLASLSAGMHVEFLSVYHDVQKTLENLGKLKSLLDDAHQAAKDKIKSSDDDLMKRDMTDIEDVYTMLMGEFDRQTTLLANLLNIQLMPTAKDLAEVLRRGKSSFGHIASLKLKPGTESFGKVIHDVLQNMGITAKFASVIDQALKRVGMTMQEYSGTNSVEKLREKVVQGLTGKNLSEEELHQYLSAADFLFKNLYRSKDIEAAARSGAVGAKSGAGDSAVDDSMSTNQSDNISHAATGGSDADGVYGGTDAEYRRSTTDKRIEDRKKVRNLVFNSFYKQVSSLFDKLLGALDVLSRKVGTEIPLSDQLDGFRQLFTRITDNLVRKPNIYYALIGYYNDAMSKSHRDEFVGNLKMLSSFIDTMLEMPLYKQGAGYLEAVKAQIAAITTVIDRYSDEIAAKFGRGEDAPAPALRSGGDEDIMGGADGLAPDMPRVNFKSTKSIADAVRQFDYNYKVAQVRQNMDRSGKEMDAYAEKYEKITSHSIADYLAGEKKNFDAMMELCESKSEGTGRGKPSPVAPRTEGAVPRRARRGPGFKPKRATTEAVPPLRRMESVSSSAAVSPTSSGRSIASARSEDDDFGSKLRAMDEHIGAFTDSLGAALTMVDGSPEQIAQLGTAIINFDDGLSAVLGIPSDDASVGSLRAFIEGPGKPRVFSLRDFAAAEEVAAFRAAMVGLLNELLKDKKYATREAEKQKLRKYFADDSMGNEIYDMVQEARSTAAAPATDVHPKLPDRVEAINNTLRTDFNNRLAEWAEAQAVNPDDAHTVLDRSFHFLGELVYRSVMESSVSDFNPNDIPMSNGKLFMQLIDILQGWVDPDDNTERGRAQAVFVELVKNLAERFKSKLGDEQWNARVARFLDTENDMVPHMQLIVQRAAGRSKRTYAGGAGPTISGEEWKSAKKFLELQWESKKKFWSTVQAVDEYLRIFANGLVKSPSDIRDIKSMLDDIETINDWYSSKTGNLLADVFESFPTDPASHKKGAGFSSKEHYFEQVKDGTVGIVGAKHNPTAVVPSAGIDMREKVGKVFKVLGALKNMMSVFVHVGSKFGGEELRKKVFLTPAQIYTNLVDYIQASAFVQGSGVAGGMDEKRAKLRPEKWGEATSAYENWGICMRFIAPQGKNPVDFTKEDQYFVYVLKSIAAKIFTVTGMYDVLDRPYESNALGPIRMIVGGDEPAPKIEDGAVALYLRLPLMCQFYRELFGFESDVPKWDNNGALPIKDAELSKISMVPDFDGTFAGLIKLIFRKTKYVDSSSYTDEDVKEIIRECNAIYQKMVQKYPQNTVMETIYELVAEVNRRYGLITKADRNRWEKEFGYRYDYAQNLPGDDYDEASAEYPILPGEEDEEIQRQSGALRLLSQKLPSSAEKKSQFALADDHKKVLYRFRCIIDKHFKDAKEEYSFSSAIKSAQMKLRNETRDEERLRIVSTLIRGVDVYSKVDGMKYVMFHETVVTGLNVLSGVHTLLARFQKYARLLDIEVLQREMFRVLAKRTKIDVETPSKIAANLANQDQCDEGKIFHADDWLIEMLAGLLGEDENKARNGGQGGDSFTTRRYDSAPRSVSKSDLVDVFGGDFEAHKEALKSSDKSKETKAKKRAAKFYFRYLFDREFMMKNLLETIFGLSHEMQGLVDIRIENDKLYINYGGMKAMVEELFDCVSYFINVLRPHVDPELITKYTDKMNVGSYYWLQEQLMEKIIVGRPGRDKLDGEDDRRSGYPNLDVCVQGLSRTWKFLTRKYKFDASQIGSTGADRISNKPSRNNFDKVFAEMIFYDATKVQSGLIRSDDANDGGIEAGATSPPKLVDYMTGPYESLHLSGPPGARFLDTRFAARFRQLYSWKDEYTFNRSALFSFNQLVAKYIQSFYDPATSKMYSGLITQFANGTFNRAVADYLYTYPDVAPLVAVQYQSPGDIKDEPNIAGDSKIDESEYNRKLAELIKSAMERLLQSNPAILQEPILMEKVTLKLTASGATTSADVTALQNVILKYLAAGTGDKDIGTISKELKKPIKQAALDNLLSASHQKQVRDIINGDYAALMALRIAQGLKLDTRKNENLARDFAKLYVRCNVSEEEDYEKILKDFTTAVSTYRPGSYEKPTYIVKQDKLLDVSSRLIDDELDYFPRNDTTLLTFARSERIAGKLPDESYSQLRGAEPDSLGKDSMGYEKLVQFGNRMDPDADHVLFTSLARVLNTIVTTRTTQNQAPVYLSENMADVPLYMKEKMRANLPAFRNLFAEMIARCEFIKRFMNQTSVSMDRDFSMAKHKPIHNPWPFVLKRAMVDGDKGTADLITKSRFSGILDTIVRGCQTMIAACDQTLKEVGDDPKYLEMYQGSIRDYKTQYGVEPLAPLSSLLNIMKNNRHDAVDPDCPADIGHMDMIPVHSLGERTFKFMYGVRGVLQNMKALPQLEHVGGFAQIAEQFNLMVDSRLQASKEHLTKFVKNVVRAVRYVHEARHLKGNLTSYVTIVPQKANEVPALAHTSGMFARHDMIVTANRHGMSEKRDGDKKTGSIYDEGMITITNKSDVSLVVAQTRDMDLVKGSKNIIRPVYGLAKSLDNILALTESSIKDDQIKALVSYLLDESTKQLPLPVQNIIDLNIVPINVHALMREIPLANLYNFAYTFDRMIIDLYYGGGNGVEESQAAALIDSLCDSADGDSRGKARITSARDALVALLLDPYRNVRNEAGAYEHIRGMMTGAAQNGELGRPKFLADELWGKSLLGNMVFTPSYTEVGPAESAGVKKGAAVTLVANILVEYYRELQKRYELPTDIDESKSREMADILVSNQLSGVDKIHGAFARLIKPADNNAEKMVAAAAVAGKIVTTVVLWQINMLQRGSGTVAEDTNEALSESMKNVDLSRNDYGGTKAKLVKADALNKKLWDMLGSNPMPLKTLSGSGPSELDSSWLNWLKQWYQSSWMLKTDDEPNVHLRYYRDTPSADRDGDVDYERMVDVEVSAAVAKELGWAQVDRFDTVLVRNLIFVINLYRSVRMKMQRDLTYSRDIIMRSTPIVRPQLTEFFSNQVNIPRSRDVSKNARFGWAGPPKK